MMSRNVHLAMYSMYVPYARERAQLDECTTVKRAHSGHRVRGVELTIPLSVT